MLDKGFGGKEGVVLLGELFDELLVLVEPGRKNTQSTYVGERSQVIGVLLQVIDGHVLEVDLLGTIDVGGISENANGHAGTRNMGKPSQQFRQ